MKTYEQAKKLALQRNKKVNACLEYETAYRFYDETEGEVMEPAGDVVVLKGDGKVMGLTEFILEYCPKRTFVKRVFSGQTPNEQEYQEGDSRPKQQAEPDKLLDQAIAFVRETGSASTSALQRKFRIGFARAANMIDVMEERGIVSAFNPNSPRKVL